jgi:hypothetical protein
MKCKAQREQDQQQHDSSSKCPGLFVLYPTTNYKAGKQIIEHASEQASLIHHDELPCPVLKRASLFPAIFEQHVFAVNNITLSSRFNSI